MNGALTDARALRAMSDRERIGALERLTRSGGFTALVVAASLVVAPLLLFGWVGLLGFAVLAGADPGGWLSLAALLGAGTVGVGGLIAAGTHTARTPVRTIETTLVCLAFGAGAALVVIGFVGFFAVEALAYGGPSVSSLALPSVIAAAHGVLVVAALGAVQRLKRVHAAMTGRPLDTLPTVLLVVALGLALAAVLAITSVAS